MSSLQGERRLLQHLRSNCNIYHLHDKFAPELHTFIATLDKDEREFVESWVRGHAFDTWSQQKKFTYWTRVFSKGPPQTAERHDILPMRSRTPRIRTA